MRLRRIEVCGGIASGKTTLAELFRNGAVHAVFEDYAKNPFWKRFYADPQRYTFETEISFLLQHYSLIRDAVSAIRPCIFDFSPLQDLAYADVNLSSSRWNAFNGVYRQVAEELGEPRVLVHLICGAEEELERIRRRNRRVESSIQLSYLNDLNEAISARVAAVAQKVEVLVIDSEHNDFANNKDVQSEMRNLILGKAGLKRASARLPGRSTAT